MAFSPSTVTTTTTTPSTPGTLGFYDVPPTPTPPTSTNASTPSSNGEIPTPPPSSNKTSMPTAISASSVDLGFTPPTSDPSPLPPSGPAFYAARRQLWLTPKPGLPRSRSPSTSRGKLEELLGRPDAMTNDAVWESGVKSVWKGLVTGGKLRRSLPLDVVIKILKAGWIRDGTWPEGSIDPPPSPPPQQRSASFQTQSLRPAQPFQPPKYSQSRQPLPELYHDIIIDDDDARHREYPHPHPISHFHFNIHLPWRHTNGTRAQDGDGTGTHDTATDH